MGDKKDELMDEIYDFIKELYLEEEEKKIELKERYIKNTFSINRFKREKIQYEKVSDDSLEFFNPNANLLDEKIQEIQDNIGKLSREQEEEEKKLQVVEKRMNKIHILRCLLEDREEEKQSNETQRITNGKNKSKSLDKQKTENTTSILKTHEAERQRIARDLHDTTVQNLTNLIHKTEYCNIMMDKDPVKVKLELAIMQETLKSTIEEMRSIIYDLRPMSIDDLGLTGTTQEYVKKMEKQYSDITFDLSIGGKEKKLDSVTELTIFRIIQEACNNVLKYGKATLIFIEIEYTDTTLEVSVEDDGIGFNFQETIERREKDKKFGLSIMQERANLIAAKLNIVSELEKGTSIKLVVPIE